MQAVRLHLLGASLMAVCFACGPSFAQEHYAAGQLWGTDPSGVAVGGALTSAAGHLQQGTIAGQVHAAEEGFLLSTGSGGSLSIQAIGSQSIVTSTIAGNNISSTINATQSATNSGSVSNNGTITSP